MSRSLPDFLGSCARLLLVALMAGSGLGALQAQGDSEFRDFTNKEGRTIEARIVAISPDRTTLTIAQRDGREFELEIVLLSLDDQQHLREWLQNRPANADYRIEVAIDKSSEKPSARERDRNNYYRLSTDFLQYRLTVTNLSRETLPAPVIEYLLVYRDNISIVYDEDERDWDFTLFGSDGIGEVKKVEGQLALEDLVYNREQIVTTETLEVHKVLGDGNFIYGEDELIGLILQVRDGQGNVIETFRSSDNGIRTMTWEQLGGKATGGSSTTNAPVNTSTSASASMAPTGMIATNELDAYPSSLQKGDVVRRQLAPDPDGRPVVISATVDVDEADPDGTIFSYGGKNKGYGLVVAEEELQLWVRRTISGADQSHVSVPIEDLPSGEFEVKAEITEDAMAIFVNGEQRVSGPSIGLIEGKPMEGINIGFDGSQTVGPNPAPDPFAGAIRDVRFELGN